MEGEMNSHGGAEAQLGKGYDELWLWFGLSHAGWLTLPRVLMHEMPDAWQNRMAALLNEWDDAWPNQPDITIAVHCRARGRIEKVPAWLSNYRHPDYSAIETLRLRASVANSP